MAALTETPGFSEQRDILSGTPRAHAIDRWIFVFMAVWFIAIVLAGFIPDSLMKVAMVESGLRPPFPIVLHMHAVLMGSFLLLLLAQTTLMATGRREYHMQLGLVGYALAALLVIVGFILVPTMYHQVWGGAQMAPPEARDGLAGGRVDALKGHCPAQQRLDQAGRFQHGELPRQYCQLGIDLDAQMAVAGAKVAVFHYGCDCFQHNSFLLGI
jgi:hypothetical protein